MYRSRLIVISLALSCGSSASAAESPGAARAELEGEIRHCYGKLERVLREAGYTHALVYDPELAAASVVDATEALRAERGVDVALLSDGARMHAVAPFLTHGRARMLVRYAANRSESAPPWRQLCIFARTVQEDAGMRAWQRTILVLIAAAGWSLFGVGMLVLSRLDRARRQKAI